jgi:ubiquinol-cytochrome c reductase cytochrome c subunit
VTRAAIVLVFTAAVLCASPAAAQESLVQRGRDLYVQGCISCHGPEGRGVSTLGPARGAGGVRGAGPSLRGVGALAADFYLSTGYMPLDDPYDQPHRNDPAYDRAQIRALVAYIASFGGPRVPRPNPHRGSVALGMRLFTEHCSGCHQIVGQGGVVPGGVAPALDAATPVQVAEAVRIGPYLMPRFSKRQVTDRQLDSIIAYVEYAERPLDKGGWSIGHVGPVPEGIVAWLVAGGVLVLTAVVIGAKGPR